MARKRPQAARTLTTQWLAEWKPTKREEVADRQCPGLFVRGGPSGAKVFYRWDNGAKDERTGKKRRVRVKLGRWLLDGGDGGSGDSGDVTLSLAAARAKFLDARESARRKVDGTAVKTLGDLAAEYREAVLSHREEKSREWSWGIIERHVLAAKLSKDGPELRNRPAAEVTASVLSKVIEQAAKKDTTGEAKAKRRTGGPAVARAALREVKAILATAVGRASIPASPAVTLSAKALGLRGTKRRRRLDAEEIKALFDALHLNAILDGTARPAKLSETVRLGIALLLYCPVRSHSLIGAQWREVDLDAARWTVPVARLKLHREARADARPFVVPLPPTAVAILRKLEALAGESPYVLASPRDPSQHIGEKVLIRALARLQRPGEKSGKAARLALGTRFTIHDLRRSWRSMAGELGVPFEIAEKSLGHALPGVADTYAAGDYVERRAEAAALVAAAFDRIRLGSAATVVPLAERAAAAS